MTTSIAWRVAVPALLALGLTACGSNTDSTNAADEPATTEMADMNTNTNTNTKKNKNKKT